MRVPVVGSTIRPPYGWIDRGGAPPRTPPRKLLRRYGQVCGGRSYGLGRSRTPLTYPNARHMTTGTKVYNKKTDGPGGAQGLPRTPPERLRAGSSARPFINTPTAVYQYPNGRLSIPQRPFINTPTAVYQYPNGRWGIDKWPLGYCIVWKKLTI